MDDRTEMTPKDGPNRKRLVIREFSTLAVPDGGGFPDALSALSSPGTMESLMRQASRNVDAYIELVKSAPDNPHKTDEEICGEILRQIEEKEKSRK